MMCFTGTPAARVRSRGARGEEMFRLVGISARAHQRLSAISSSGGMRQRIVIARLLPGAEA